MKPIVRYQAGNIDIGFQSGNIYAAIARTCLRASKRSAKRKALLAVSREIVMELIALSMDSSRGRGNHLVKKHF